MSDNPIGIFDSGIGGLTVCKAINNLLPGEDLIYFGDTARFPYGTRSKETIIKYSREITEYLISRNVKMIVIACNTASASALYTIKDENNLPVIGVIDAGARAACKNLKGNSIGVIGTKATVSSKSYIEAIKKIIPGIEVHQKQTTLFVPLIEEGFIESEITRLTVIEYIQSLYDMGIRTLILGCTHFPLLKNVIEREYNDLILVDTGIEIAYEIEKILKEKNLENNGPVDYKGKIELYTSDITETLTGLKDIFFDREGTTIQKLEINGLKK